MANVTDLQTKYSKLAQEYSKVSENFYCVLNKNEIKWMCNEGAFIVP